jgi:hypothetical protein
MKTSKKTLIREALMDDMYMSEDDAKQFILSQDGDEVTDVDIIDEETGEVYLKAGDDFCQSPWSPDHKLDKKRADKDETYAERAGVWQDYFGPGSANYDEEDDDYEADSWDRYQKGREADRQAWYAAVEEFAGQYTDFKQEVPDVSPEDAAGDVSDNFFLFYPDWQTWARSLEMNKQSMKEALVDYVYEAMISGKAPKIR